MDGAISLRYPPSMVTTDPNMVAPRAGAQARALLTLGLPLIGSHIAQMAIQITDTVMLGWYDVTALAGMTIAASVFFVLFLVGSGFAWAVMPMVASAAETGDHAQVRRVTRMGLWLSLGFALLSLPVGLMAKPILLGLGQDPQVAELGSAYLTIALFGLAPALVITVLKGYLSALEHTRIILVVTCVSAAFNVALTYALVFGNWGAPELGVAGAAIASVVLQVVGMIWLALYAATKTPQYQLFRNPHRGDWPALVKVVRLGAPIGLTNLSEVGLFAGSSVLMGWLGAVPLAAHGIAMQISAVTFMIHLGLSQAVTVRVGQAFGRGNAAGVRQVASVGLSLSIGFACVTILVFLSFGAPLVGLFVAPDDPVRPEILAAGVLFLMIAAVFQLMDGAQVLTLGMLRGVQDTTIPMLLAAFGYWCVGIPASYVLGFKLGFGGAGIWWGLVIGLIAVAGLLSWRFWSARIESRSCAP